MKYSTTLMVTRFNHRGVNRRRIKDKKLLKGERGNGEHRATISCLHISMYDVSC